MAIIVKKIFLGWLLLFALLLPSCGQVCIMGQGECPTVKVETKLTLSTSQPTTLTKLNNDQQITFQINGGAPNFTISASWQTTNLGSLENPPAFNSGTSASRNINTSSFDFFINGTTLISSPETITITAKDTNGKEATATITVNPPVTN